MNAWQSSGGTRWTPWTTLAQTLWKRFQETPADDPQINRLEMVGALEESIIAIERLVFQQGQGANAPRDVALSQLYMTYAQTLMNLSPHECFQLALDPHTLLIGAAEAKTEPSTHVCVENAENSLRNAATLDATNTKAEELLQQLLGGESGESVVHKRKPKEFVAELFDSFASSFDEKLVQHLQYKVPELVGGLAQQLLVQDDDKTEYHAILDAGCGTGLAGRHLRPLLKKDDGVMIGVDASQKMLDKAAVCTLDSGCGLETTATATKESSPPLYEALLQLDLEDMTIDNTLGTLSQPTTTFFDLIVAADVFVYFGSLEVILAKFASLSSPSAVLIFTTELATDAEAPLGWRLLGSGRFAHTKQHVLEVAQKAGYELRQYQEIIPRMEKGEPVQGQIFGLQLLPKQHEPTKREEL
eukprot:CAMPEP_0172446638 /NCGR_PEP_ID=MMETSP1065-20121228/6196_1 /TAXON_ID=265537 /ORGANISM="Amphiprora paludosa, Strain CCMP125" /LENGTH=414 /DNA_ID=CAMNT_0013197809 /DNA_START=116 /DNA_END=1360 /DNA_ORIENTATION=+